MKCDTHNCPNEGTQKLGDKYRFVCGGRCKGVFCAKCYEEIVRLFAVNKNRKEPNP